MQYRLLTPSQFESLRPLTDIAIVTTHSPWPLAHRLPHAASDLIVDQITNSIRDRFMGRTVEVNLGVALAMSGFEFTAFTDSIQSFVPSLPITLVLLDRMLIRDRESHEWPNGRCVFALDWWQWLRARVPEDRLQDAFLYLCLSHPAYQTSLEFRSLGIQSDTAKLMADYGHDLLSHIVCDACDALLALQTKLVSSSTD